MNLCVVQENFKQDGKLDKLKSIFLCNVSFQGKTNFKDTRISHTVRYCVECLLYYWDFEQNFISIILKK